MTVEQALKEIGINLGSKPSKSTDGSYVVDIPNIDVFAKYYSLLDRNADVQEEVETSLLTLHDIRLSYLYKEMLITLMSDNDQDLYKMVIKPLTQAQLAQYAEEDEDEDVEDEEVEGEE